MVASKPKIQNIRTVCVAIAPTTTHAIATAHAKIRMDLFARLDTTISSVFASFPATFVASWILLYVNMVAIAVNSKSKNNTYTIEIEIGKRVSTQTADVKPALKHIVSASEKPAAKL